MDERALPAAQPSKDRASHLPSDFQQPARFSNNKKLLLIIKNLARDLGIIFHDQLTFKDHVTTTARSCRFVQPRPGHCFFWAGLLQCSSGWTYIMCNQSSSNDSELVFNEPKRANVTPLLICTGFRLQLTSSSR